MTVSLSYAREGERLHLRGETEASLRLLEEGVHRFPGDVTGRIVLARVHRENGRAAEARTWLESVLRADAECPAARLQLAEMLDGAEGESHFARLREQEPWDEGFLRAVEEPVFAEPSTARAAAPVTLETFEDEEDEAEPEIDIDSLPHVATVTLAEIYLQQGLKEQAAQIYRQLLERQPGDVSVRKRLEEIETSTSEARLETGGVAGGNG
jgi:tetratricopeptide (TPR) repeat protein